MINLIALNVTVALFISACGDHGSRTNRFTQNSIDSVQFSVATERAADDDGTIDGTLIQIADLHDARAAHKATLLNDGNVLITGGFAGSSSNGLASVEIFNPTTNTFIKINPMLAARFDHSATLLPDGKVLIAGGYNGAAVATTEIYDPVQMSFSVGPTMNTARYGHTATPLNDGRILFAGGVGTGWSFLASAEVFDIETNRFITVNSMVVPRESHTATLLTDGNVLIIGGHRDRREHLVVYASSEIFDSKTNQFSESGNLQIPRHKHDAILLADGKVLVVGGADRRDSLYKSAEIYDPNVRQFASIPDLNSPRFKFRNASIMLPDKNVLIAGGSNKVELYDFVKGTFRPLQGDLGVTRYFSSSTLLSNGNVLIAGGYDANISATRKASLFVAPE